MTISSTLAGNLGAIVSVRGYLYQFAKVIEYLLLAVDGDAVVCVETFDDIAIETSDGGRQLVQVRHRAARFSLLAEPGLKLLESWLDRNLPPNATFAFVSTQHLVNGHFVLPDSDNDLSDSDIDSIRAKLTDKVDGLRKKEFKKLRKVLSDAVEFKTFWGRIKWSVGQDEEKEGIDSLTIAMESLEKTALEKFGEGGEARPSVPMIVRHFPPDGRTLLTASRDATARLWDVKTFAEKTLLSGHLDQIDIATFSPDGRYVLTASKDMSARLWDASDGQTLATFLHRGAVVDARFFPDGAHVVTASYEGGVQVNPASFERFAATARKLLAYAGPAAAACPVKSPA